MARKLVVDANIAIWAVLPTVSVIQTIDRFTAWRESDVTIYAPSLWLAECTSVLRRYVYAGKITSAEGRTALDDLAALAVEVIPSTYTLCHAAYEWAERLKRSKAYDGFYLALADDLNAIFITGDKALFNSVQALGLSWVREISEEV